MSETPRTQLKQIAKQWLPPVVQRAGGRVLRAVRPPPQMEGFQEVERLGLRWRLDMGSIIAQRMVRDGIWEPETTQIVFDYVKPGMQVLSVGANFGYYVLLMARSVGDAGHVWAFEPTEKYREQLNWHLETNGLADRVTVVPYGLSDKETDASIGISPQSASMHFSPHEREIGREQIHLRRLDDVAAELGITRVDFLNIDIDGHEPAFFRGARETLKRDLPPIAMEFAQLFLHFAGSDVRELASLLHEIGYEIRSERTREPFPDETSFLCECGNFLPAANGLAVKNTLAKPRW